jgi:plastocyanin
MRMDVDPHCAALHAGVVLNDDLVVDPKGGVRWAFVYVKSGLKAAPPPAPQTPVLLDQIGCVFTPHVLGVRVGQPLQIRNSDPRLHNIHALSFDNLEMNVSIVPDTETVHRFTKREVMVPVKCDIHPWMAAWVGVLDHPYFAVTGEEGAFAIPDLPPGRYVVEVWHEKYVSVSREYDVILGDEDPLDFLLDARKP